MTLGRAGFPLEAVRGLGDRFAALSRPRRWAAAASLGWACSLPPTPSGS